jgi:hypothetical protein
MICGHNLKRTKLIIGYQYTTMTVIIELCVCVCFFKLQIIPFKRSKSCSLMFLTADSWEQCLNSNAILAGWIRNQRLNSWT